MTASTETMKIPLVSIILVSVLLLPYALNIFGKNIFLYLGSSGSKVVIAASQGLCHMAITTESHDYDAMKASFSDYGVLPAHRQIVKAGPVDLFTEQRLDPMYWFRFDLTRGGDDYDYSAIEFPWMLIPLLPLILLFLIIDRKMKKEK